MYNICVRTKVRNGSNSQAPLLGKLCGEILPSPIHTWSNVLFLKFVTDSSSERRGFDLTFTSSPTGT